jgi:uncharacterized damage-inducible protein DinB
MNLCDHLRIQARANRLANHRLHAAMAVLSNADFQAPRTGFFPSLAATLNHILMVDQYYVAALHRDAGLDSGHWDRFVADAALPGLAERQRQVDERLIGFCDALDAAGCERIVEMPRDAGEVRRDAAAHVLAHLFMHQTHHRGQAHSMLSGTAVNPPQLDEFLMPSDAPFRVADMAALGWDEAGVYGRR